MLKFYHKQILILSEMSFSLGYDNYWHGNCGSRLTTVHFIRLMTSLILITMSALYIPPNLQLAQPVIVVSPENLYQKDS